MTTAAPADSSGISPAPPSQVAVVATSVLTTISCVYPAFLVGGLGVQLREELAISERFFGIIFGSFFFGAMISSVLGGRLVERIGARRALMAALILLIVVDLTIAAFATSGEALLGLLSIAGVANAVGQTGANKLLSQASRERLALAIAIKQSGMPSSTLLAGLAVPAIALTVGWRWAYVSAAVVAALALAMAIRTAPPQQGVLTSGGQPVSTMRSLRTAAVGAAFAAGVAGTLGGWLVSSATEAGIAEGPAGLLLSFGSLVGISVRLLVGSRADASDRRPVAGAAFLLGGGAIGLFLFALGSAWMFIPAAIIAFGLGWAWPALFNYGVVRTNIAAPGAATGVTQTGVYVGVLSAPIAFGFLVDGLGYSWAWILAGFSALLGAGLFWAVADDF